MGNIDYKSTLETLIIWFKTAHENFFYFVYLTMIMNIYYDKRFKVKFMVVVLNANLKL